jgi:threonine dehydrogenase-like Zn-dependent dehydrogenase
METANKCKVAAVCGDGHLRVIEQDVPALMRGTVLVDVKSSLVSPGTELNGWRGLAEKRRHPDAAAPRPFGYSNAGTVREAGEGVTEFKPGDRVACIGAGYALHTDCAVVPHHLCVALPQKVSFAQGAYAMLAATALHTLRRGEPEFGESVCVLGLGLAGQLAAQLYKLAGNFVIGWDRIESRLQIAKKWGIDATVAAGAGDEVAATRGFTRGLGLDAAVMANAGECDEIVDKLVRAMKVSPDGHPMGRIMVVGWPTFRFANLIGGMNNIDIRRCSRTGPGYHDDPWEVGNAYPPVFMRWTTRTNLELCVRLIEEGRLNVDALTTHRIPFQDLEARVDRLLDDPDALLGVVIEY